MMLKPLSITSRDGTGAIACAVLACFLLLGGVRAEAQVSAGGTPPTFVDPGLCGAVPTVTMPLQNNAALLAQDSIDIVNACAGNRWMAKFGQEILIDTGFADAGLWDTVEYDGDSVRLWLLRVASPGATTVSFIFDAFELPDGARLFIYNEEHDVVLGAFTAANNKAHGRFATLPVSGDSVTLEYVEPLSATTPGQLNIEQVIHGYTGLFSTGGTIPDVFGQGHGDCHHDVECSQGSEWCREKRAVCIMIYGPRAVCTGTLLTTTQTVDGAWDTEITPYVLTAFHCVKGTDSDGSVSADMTCVSCGTAVQTPECYPPLLQSEKDHVRDWIFLYGYYAPTCNAPNPRVDTLPSFHGGIFRSENYAVDMALLEMEEQPGSEHGVYFAGWDRSTTPPGSSTAASTAGIHHPGGEEMKISRTTIADFSNAMGGWDRCPLLSATTNSHWAISWDENEGTTEPGSSGSALFSPDHHVIGHLTGNNQFPPDVLITPVTVCQYRFSKYGRLSLSWDVSNMAGNSLKHWLDAANEGVDRIDGTYVPMYYYNFVVGNGTTIIHRVFNTIEIAGKRPATNRYNFAEFRVNSGGLYTVQSPRRITIRTGFRATIGSRFHAYIDEVDCDDVGILYRGHPRYQWSGGGSGKQVALGEEPGGTGSASEQVWLSTASPNPFNGATRIAFTVPSSGKVSLVVYDRNGRQVDLLIDAEERATGQYTIDYAPRHLPAGTYFYVYTCGERTETRQLVVIR